MKFKSIDKRILFTFVMLTILVTGTLAYLTFTTIEKEINKGNVDLDNSVTLLNALMDGKSMDALGLARVYASDNRIVEILKSKNRDEMNDYISPIFKKYSQTLGLSVFEVGEDSGEVFYRGHNPESFGDSKISQNSIAVALEGKENYGRATGSSGINIRAFVPIVDNNKIIGTLQVGFGSEFFNTFVQVSNVNLELFDLENLIYASDENHQRYINESISNYSDEGKKYVEDALKGKEQRVQHSEEISYYLPVREPVENEIIGVFKFNYDLGDILKERNQIMMINVFLILIFVFIIFMTLLSLRKKLTRPIIEFTELLSQISKMTFARKYLKIIRFLIKRMKLEN